MNNISKAAAILLTMIMAGCGDKEQPQPQPQTDPGPGTTGKPEISSDGAPESEPQPATSVSPQNTYWSALQSICKQKYAGQLTIGTEESDYEIGYADLRMHVKRCRKKQIDIGFSVDDDNSRTWLLRKLDNGISLHHRHLHEDGKEDDTSGYGGATEDSGTATRQDFPADKNTGEMIPAAATNVWTIEIKPGETFAYQLERAKDERMFRVVFDLTKPLPDS